MFVLSMTEEFSNETAVCKTPDSVIAKAKEVLDDAESVLESDYDLEVNRDTNSATLTASTSEGKFVLVFIGDKAEANVEEVFAAILKAQDEDLDD